MDFDFSTETITPDNSGTITLAGDFEITGHFQPSVATHLAAAGTTQGTATLIEDTIIIVGTCTANASDGIRLPGLTTTINGTYVSITNTAPAAVNVYPPVGGTIDIGSANAPIVLPPGACVTVVANGINGSSWITISRALVVGTNITLTNGIGTTTINSTGGGASLIVKDEGTNITTAASSLNFVGTGVTATNTGNDVTVTIAAGGGGGAPTDAQYVTLSTDATLSNERTLAVSSDFVIADGGAGSAVTISNKKGGESWTVGGALPSAASSWHRMVYGNGRFVHSCSGASHATGAISYDGINWTATTMPASASWTGIEFGNGRFVAVQSISGNSSGVSTDGVNWTLSSASLPSTSSWNFLLYGNGVFITAAYNTTSCALSLDGAVWQSVTLPTSAAWVCGAYGNGTHVIFANGSTSALTSTNNGLTWTARTLSAALSWQRAAYGNGVFIAVANPAGTTTAYTYSTNGGVTWNAGTFPVAKKWDGITFANGQFIAVGTGNQCAVSTDGINWQMKPMPSSSAWNAICYGQGKFVASISDAAITSTVYSDVGVATCSNPTAYGVTYNDKGYINTAEHVLIHSGNLVIGEALAIAPPDRGVTIFGKRLASRIMPAAMGQSGLDYTLQPAIWRQKVARWNPPGGTATAPVVDGITAFTALGTATSRSVAATNILTRTKRVGYVSAATAAALGGIYHTLAQYTTGNGSGLGGFFCAWRFAATDAAAVSGARMFVGMSSSVAAATNVEPSTITNCIGIAQLSTSSTQLYVVYGGSAAQTAIPLGTNFPPMAAAGATNGVAYELSIFASPNLNGVIGWRVERIGTSYVAEGVITPAVVGTQTPASSTLLSPRAWRTNNATLLAVGLDIITLYLETDY